MALLHKYMSKADEWMVLGSIAGSPVTFDDFGFVKGPWQEDPEMDRLVDEEDDPWDSTQS